MTQALVSVPAKARRGDVIEIKTLIAHPMETGYRVGVSGEAIPRDILHTLSCTYNGEEIFHAELHPAIAANPFVTFFTTATESGVIVVSWTGDDGTTRTQQAKIAVE